MFGYVWLCFVVFVVGVDIGVWLRLIVLIVVALWLHCGCAVVALCCGCVWLIDFQCWLRCGLVVLVVVAL